MRGIVIAVAGASCSGKTTLAEALGDTLGAAVLRIDDYYLPFDHLTFEERCDVNFDEPAAIDHRLLVSHVSALLAGDVVEAPRYDFTCHARKSETKRIEPGPILIVEGLFALCYPELVEQCSVRIFVEASDDVCLERRIERDVAERGRTPGEVVSRFHGHVWPMYLRHIEPSRRHATVVVSGLAPVSLGISQVASAIR